jgi:hypothetical protein
VFARFGRIDRSGVVGPKRATGKKGDALDGTTRQANYSFVKALVLAKAIVRGKALGIGDHFHNRPPIISTLYRRLYFGILMLGFSVQEQMPTGLLRASGLHRADQARSTWGGFHHMSRPRSEASTAAAL